MGAKWNGGEKSKTMQNRGKKQKPGRNSGRKEEESDREEDQKASRAGIEMAEHTRGKKNFRHIPPHMNTTLP